MAIIIIGIAIVFTLSVNALNLQSLPLIYFLRLIAILLSYCILMQLVKNWYIPNATNGLIKQSKSTGSLYD
ncbi:MAG: hypothetical protein J7502_16600 [Flavisolibacter sp.]|nr:hypothetical protein [Flavisolibacter sp.]